MKRALILGGTGQIGIAVAARLDCDGREVTLASRTPPEARGPWRHVAVDCRKSGALRGVIGSGADLLLDCIAFDERDAARLMSAAGDCGHVCAISSASVYADRQGRTLDEAAETGFSHFPVLIGEDHPTVAPGPATYSTRKVAMERHLLAGVPDCATVLRPGAIHGPMSRHAREWWVVKRVLDGRRRIPLVFEGASRFHTTSVAAIAEAVVRTANGAAPPVANVADPEAPSVMEIARAILAAMGADAELVPIEGNRVGVTPWSVERPMILYSALPVATGRYRDLIGPTIAWLAMAVRGRDWRAVLPVLAAYPRELFDYAAEDRALVDVGAVSR